LINLNTDRPQILLWKERMMMTIEIEWDLETEEVSQEKEKVCNSNKRSKQTDCDASWTLEKKETKDDLEVSLRNGLCFLPLLWRKRWLLERNVKRTLLWLIQMLTERSWDSYR
jgi:hypothetical protein